MVVSVCCTVARMLCYLTALCGIIMSNFAGSHRLHSQMNVFADCAMHKSISTRTGIHVYANSAYTATDVALERALLVFKCYRVCAPCVGLRVY